MKQSILKKNWFIIAMLVLVFPFGIFLMWKNAEWKIASKILVCVCYLLIPLILLIDISPKIEKIKIQPESIILGHQCIAILDVKVTPENANIKKIDYVSSDNSIAYAKDGRVYSMSDGEVKIYAIDKKSNTISNEINVTVANKLYTKQNAEVSTELESQDAVESGKEIVQRTETSEEDGSTVYVGKTGTKYHKKDCSCLKGGGTAIPIEKAKTQGRTPCKICYK